MHCPAFLRQGQNVKHYVLTHFHGDHTVGLTRAFNGGTIYCTAFRLQEFGVQNLYCADAPASFRVPASFLFLVFVFPKACSSGCDSCLDHQHDGRGSFPCYCEAFGGDNRSNLPQIFVLQIVHRWVLNTLLSKFVVAISCHVPFCSGDRFPCHVTTLNFS